jgi:hypothetical protein
MKCLLLRLLVVNMVVLCSLQLAEGTGSNPRTVVALKHDWTFNYFPASEINVQNAYPDFDDSQWSAVSLPHTWQTYETTGELHPFIKSAGEQDNPYWWNGLGWYRKRLIISDAWEGKRFFIEFDGAQKHCWIFVNGVEVGEHLGGYNSFSLDVTDQIKPGRSTVIAVAVSNRRDDPERIPPMTAGNFDVYGGIYRDVRLVIKNPLHIPYQGNWQHEGGTFITTPQVGENRVVHIRTYVKNDYGRPVSAMLETTIVSPSGKILETIKSTEQVAPGQIQEVVQVSGPVDEPQLWSFDCPSLYKVESRVYLGNQLVDQKESIFGFRWFHWDNRTSTLLLNGEPVHIRGTNRHQEYPWLGDAIPKWLHKQELRQIRHDMGMNFMRAAHYPNDPLVYYLADELGIIMVEEVPNIEEIDFSEEVQERNARAMVRRDRNHPSVLFWSVGNETNDPAAGVWIHEEDSARIIHLRHGSGGDEYVTHTHKQLEMENQLRVTIRGWTDYTVKDARPANNQHAGTEEWQHFKMRTHDDGRARIDEDIVHWLYADHGADREYDNAPLKHVNPKGWLDLYRIPKYGYHLWRANAVEEPVLFIHPHVWIEENIGSKKDVRVDTNADQVELFVNAKSRGVKKACSLNFNTVVFRDVAVEKGSLKVVGTKGKEEITRELVMPGKPAKLRLYTENNPIYAERSEIAVVRVDILDKDGYPVYNATNELHWKLEGPASWVGPELYESDLYKHEVYEGTMYTTAPVKNILRACPETGEITVTVLSPGLMSDKLTIQSLPCPRSPSIGIEQPHLRLENRPKVVVKTNPAFR